MSDNEEKLKASERLNDAVYAQMLKNEPGLDKARLATKDEVAAARKALAEAGDQKGANAQFNAQFPVVAPASGITPTKPVNPEGDKPPVSDIAKETLAAQQRGDTPKPTPDLKIASLWADWVIAFAKDHVHCFGPKDRTQFQLAVGRMESALAGETGVPKPLPYGQ